MPNESEFAGGYFKPFDAATEQRKPRGCGPKISSLIAEDLGRLSVPRHRVGQLVLIDLLAREAVGVKKYGEPLMAHNGRDALLDAYQELLDSCMYLRQAVAESIPGAVWFYERQLELTRSFRSLIEERG